MTNGKVVFKHEVQTGVYEYYISVIVADDFSKEHETAINGTQESIFLAIDNAGKLGFKEYQKLASEQTFSSYGWNRFSDSKPVMGAYRWYRGGLCGADNRKDKLIDWLTS